LSKLVLLLLLDHIESHEEKYKGNDKDEEDVEIVLLFIVNN